MTIGSGLQTVETTVVTDAKAVETNVAKEATNAITAIKNLATMKVNLGATVPVPKTIAVSKKAVKYVVVGLFFIGLVATQAYVAYQGHEITGLQDARATSLEAVTKQYGTDLATLNGQLGDTNKAVQAVTDAEKATDAKVTAVAQELAAVNAKLSPVRPTRKYRAPIRK